MSADRIIDELKEMGISITSEEANIFERYREEILEVNRFLNLTSIRDSGEFVTKHITDSAFLCSLEEVAGKVIDVGTGGGFPGVAVAVLKPECELTLLDSTGKKLRAVEKIFSELGLKASFLTARAEDIGRRDYRERFDTVISRAVADLPKLAEYCIPLLSAGGYMLAMKGPSYGEELERSMSAINILGGKLAGCKEYMLGDGSGRCIIKIRKIKDTPETYPRSGNLIKNKPL
ncbi:MAG: 16S rRNA (guanine(527)-N(7))-methyltransferase RsmG [Ruminococcaceae bacterium]|nr:16S rRNA (guanine(527)-N(7))-methyltransferase RsmG [Oscillospiraceae bacterium]